jgi:hypothetical protein
MGNRGNRFEIKEKLPVKEKRKRDTTKHSELCTMAAKWIRRDKGKITGINSPVKYDYAVVDLVTGNCQEIPDVFAWSSWASAMIEVKVSRSDFLAEKGNKPWRNNEFKGSGVGEYKYYCCPENLIKEDEIPPAWGLLYEINGNIVLIKDAERTPSNKSGEFAILLSIMRREGIKAQLFDYRTKK